MSDKKRPLPPLLTDEEAERFTDEEDLSDYDLSGFKPAGFRFQRKDARLELRLPKAQLDAVKRAAKERGIPYTHLVREFIERGMQSL